MRNLYTAAVERLQKGGTCVLATILTAEGSVPRTAGTQMLVFPDGSFRGTVGGGNAEQEAKLAALQLFSRKTGAVVSFRTVNGKPEAELKGGRITVGFLFLDPVREEDVRLMEKAAAGCIGAERTWLILRIPQDKDLKGEVCTEKDIRKILPCGADGPVLEENSLFAMPLPKTVRAFLFGAGHVAQKLAPVLQILGREVIVIDDRTELCSEDVFPGAECHALPPREGFRQYEIGPDDEIIAMSRSHEIDYETVECALRTDAGYIGCIGSRQKIGLIRRKLTEAGFAGPQIDRIHAPIGLDIGAVTPAEIAVSVAAEIVRCRAERR